MPNETEEDRLKAMREVAMAVRNPLMLMCAPERARVIALAVEYNITAAEILEISHRRASKI
jgi:hypothetical protein